MIASEPLVSVIVVNWNGKSLLGECLGSVRDHLAVAHETIVVDNGSTDGSVGLIEADFPDVRLVRNSENVGFGRANNQAMAIARGEFLLLLNNDARLAAGPIGELLEVFRSDPHVGVVGPRVVGGDGALQASAFRFDAIHRLFVEELGLYKLLPRSYAARYLLGGYWDHASERSVDWIAGACMFVRSDVFRALGGFDEKIFLYGEETEWCERIHAAGWKVVYSPRASVVHLGHQTMQRFFGEPERLVRCLEGSERLIGRRSGALGVSVVRTIRVAGALLRLGKTKLARVFGFGRPSDDGVRDLAIAVLRHCLPWSAS